MLTTMTSQGGQASQAGCKTPYGSSPQRSARTYLPYLDKEDKAKNKAVAAARRGKPKLDKEEKRHQRWRTRTRTRRIA